MGFVCGVRGAILYSHSRFMMIPSLIFIKLLLITSIIHPLTLLFLTSPPPLLPQRHPIPFRIRGDGESKNTSSKAQTMQKKSRGCVVCS